MTCYREATETLLHFTYIINKLKQTFYIGAEHSQDFNYIDIHLKQKDDFSITINQIDYINSINEIIYIYIYIYNI